MITDPVDTSNAPAWLLAAASVAANAWQFIKAHRSAQVDLASSSASISEFKADSAVTDAAAAQVKALLDRVTALEASHADLWNRLQEEVEKRMRLQLRVLQLEGVLKQHAIDVPPET